MQKYFVGSGNTSIGVSEFVVVVLVRRMVKLSQEIREL